MMEKKVIFIIAAGAACIAAGMIEDLIGIGGYIKALPHIVFYLHNAIVMVLGGFLWWLYTDFWKEK
ncbi:MAG: hypothetical protein WCG48_03125 [Candidatus Berkelbacteria bacterium]